MDKKQRIVIGTRGSKLALQQSGEIVKLLRKKFSCYEFTVKVIKTTGDKIRDVALSKIGGKGFFVKEIEESLFKGEIDIAVHSMKDIPAELPEGLEIAAVTERMDCRDALISKKNKSLKELPAGNIIGTSSLRRKSQILNFRADFKVVDLRGNLDTRLRKLFDGNLDAIIVAVAGLERMGFTKFITERISCDVCLPAVGQGSLGIEIRFDDKKVKKLTEILNDNKSCLAIKAERAMLRKLQGGCRIPIGAHGYIKDGRLILEGLVASLDGQKIVRDKMDDFPEKAEELGRRLACRLIERGADEILKNIG